MENNSAGLRLLKKGQKGLIRAIFSRMGLIMLLLLFNFGLLFALFIWFDEFLPQYLGGTTLFTIGMVLYLLNRQMDASAKITWLVIIMLAPVFGSLLYLFTQRDWGHRALKSISQKIIDSTKGMVTDEGAHSALASADPGAAAMASYVQKVNGNPIFRNTEVVYFPKGEDKFEQLLIELEKAEKFIFLEYFIVEEGIMWGRILEILARKAAQGADVRLMYDGTCEFLLLPKGYPKKLETLGIKCKVFSPVTPFVSTHYNYRDHRKILVIDGYTAFNGGVNLADEYINEKLKYGHWKDTAVMLKGDAVRSFTLMFLQMWHIGERTGEYEKFLCSPAVTQREAKGFVMPYCDTPLDAERVGRQVYLDILARAGKYVHIMTPYLILDQEMENALKYAAARGVDVKLILPGVPDKKAPYALAKTHFRSLLDAGVKMYLYSPGFVHAKVFVSDDREAVVGTINLDYRSLYHHFECATYLYDSACIEDIERDCLSTIEKCVPVTEEMIRNEKWYDKAAGYVLKAVAPLM